MEADNTGLRTRVVGRNSARVGYLLALAITVAWGVDHWLCTTVAPYYKWEEWPYPYSLDNGSVAPSETREILRASNEAVFFEEIRKTMVEADEIALQMVYEYHRQAEEGVRCGALPSSRRAEYRLSELRGRRVYESCPTQCIQAAEAVQLTLKETERFYHDSSQGGRGFSARALERARGAFKRQTEICAGYTMKPDIPEVLIHSIIANDCQELARVVNDWSRLQYQIDTDDWFGEKRVTWSEEVTPSRKFYQANHEKPFLRALWLLLNGKEYSPFLASAFLNWRSAIQESYFGMSEWSEIPNEQYNQVRFKVLERVEEFLREHPDNMHAQAQKEVLLGVPNIRRGTPYGNTCLYAGVWL